MDDALDPLVASRAVTDTYQRYVKTLVDVRDEALARSFAAAVDHGGALAKGPYLEATPAYSPGASLNDLVDEGVLHRGFTSLASAAMPLDRPLYAHQEQAIRKAVAGRNVVVTTGTGSGKTESFLIPIINRLVTEEAQGSLGPGVRALLLYPMNALANDQVKRLRTLLSAHPRLTFGRYTGETKERAADALAQFTALNPGQPRLSNEVLSREEMRAAPPHILLTNYAMLEYLLLRPLDLALFQGDRWAFVALDEAHVYDGAKGAEIAMLLRRLHDRVGGGRKLQCIATSASVQGRPTQIMDFATKLFASPFEWIDDDVTRQDLVTASRVASPTESTWGPLTPDQWSALRGADDPAGGMRSHAPASLRGLDPAQLLDEEASVVALKRLLADGPQTVADIAGRMFPGRPRPESIVRDLVAVASGLLDSTGNPVLSARYHQFVRATEGAFTCLSPAGPHVQLARHERCPDCTAACFEFGSCQRCGAVYLAGSLEQRDQDSYFVPSPSADGRHTWLMLGDEVAFEDEDEDVLDVGGRSAAANQTVYLCAECGALHAATRSVCGARGCSSIALRPVRKFDRSHKVMSSCTRCGARAREVVRRLQTGSDAPPSVLTTALYQQLPPGPSAAADLPGQGRKLLLFSDSRQAAAFAAPYLENTYGQLQQRSLLVDGLGRAVQQAGEVGAADLVYYTLQAADESDFFASSATRDTKRREVARWLALELVAMDRRQSLEGLGLLVVRHQQSERALPAPLVDVGLDEVEGWDLLEEMVGTMRQQGAITMPSGVDHKDEAFLPRVGPIYMRQTGSEKKKKKVLSWSPTRGTNRRFDYLVRVLEKSGHQSSAAAMLSGCWKFIEQLGWLASTTDRTLGTLFQDDVESLRFTTEHDGRWFRCSRCGVTAPRSVRSVCPTLRCDGVMVATPIPSTEEDDQHYRRLYRTMHPIPLQAQEHTAQWSSTRAAEIQNDFVDGKTNVLSCSTTFELGVDVGDLQSVVLRNMPPSTANYVQRAGRAGRRAASAALVLTFAQRRSHDLSRFQNPERMIAGHMRVPIIPLENDRIDRRHAHSIAMAAYFRACFQADGSRWSKVGQFFTGPGGSTPSDGVRSFLTPVPSDVLASLRAVLPPGVGEHIGIEDGSWVGQLCDLLDLVRDEVTAELADYQKRIDEFVSAKKFGPAQAMSKTIETINGRDLLGYLGSRNVLPKYGFPVDTVELRTLHSSEPVGRQLELSRDLSQAIYDYAPGNQVIAGGKRWTSAGLHRFPGKDLVAVDYQACGACGAYVEGADATEPACSACTTAYSRGPRTYVIPEFGFNCDPDPTDVGTGAPERRWGGATHIQSLGAEVFEKEWTMPSGALCRARAGARGRISVISDAGGPQFHICDWCGWTIVLQPGQRWSAHKRPTDRKDCNGGWSQRSLGHSYETDIVELTSSAWDTLTDDSDWLSLLYAIVRGATERLEISEDDLDGALFRSPNGRRAVVLFDTVPGGAGGAKLVADSLDLVVRGALDRVSSCECGPETACYGCLRSYRNARHHEQLSRAGAQRMLAVLGHDLSGAPLGALGAQGALIR